MKIRELIKLVVGSTLMYMIAMGALIAVLLWAFGIDNDKFARYDAHCVQAGGHIYQPGSNHYCLSPDGRMLEVYP
jgi:hypothetical protein